MTTRDHPRPPLYPSVGGGIAKVCTLSTLLVAAAAAQSLDEAVNDQLDASSGTPCFLLLGTDAPDVLEGELREICERGLPAGGTGTSSASGGGAGTAASMPEAVKRRLDEEPAEGGPVRGFFATLSTGASDRDVTEFQDGYQGDVSGLLVGLDRESGNWVAGFTIESVTDDGAFQGGGSFETTSLGFTGFGSRVLSEKAAVDFYAGFERLSNDRVRTAKFIHLDPDGDPFFESEDGLPSADFDATELLAGAQFTFGVSNGNLTFGPKLALDWGTTEFDAYTETEVVESGLALNFYQDERRSLVTTVGLDAAFAISTDFGVVVLSEYLYWKHEYDDEQRFVDVSFVLDTRAQRFRYQTEPPDEDFLEFGVSVIFLFQRGLQLFAAFEQTGSHSFLDTQVLSAGIRKEF